MAKAGGGVSLAILDPKEVAWGTLRDLICTEGLTIAEFVAAI